MPGQLRFKDRVAIVTGAASGIGLATAQRIAADGGRLVIADISLEKLKSVEGSLQEAGAPAVWSSACDVSRSEQVAATAAGAMERFGRLDIIVNCAGIMVFKPLEEHTPEDWMKILGVDLLGAFFFTQQGFRHMKNGGAIVNVSSIHAVETTPLVTAYAAAKAAVLSLTRSAAIEGKAKGIRVNAVLPGAIATPMLWDNPNIKAGLEVIQKSDVGKPEDIASAIAYLASDEAGFIQGEGLRIDGGRLARL